MHSTAIPHIEVEVGPVRLLTRGERERYAEHNFKYVVMKPCVCQYGDRTITAPKGFMTDGATFAPDLGIGWLIHDVLYARHTYDDGEPITRRKADLIMYHLLEFERHNLYKRIMWFTSYVLRPVFDWAWRSSGRRGMILMHPESCIIPIEGGRRYSDPGTYRADLSYSGEDDDTFDEVELTQD